MAQVIEYLLTQALSSNPSTVKRKGEGGGGGETEANKRMLSLPRV
jgi:hypothetical protein